MAIRPIFVPDAKNDAFVREVLVTFTYYAGFSLVQKQKSIASLHAAAANLGIQTVLEISTKSPLELGTRLSAFNLMFTTKDDKQIAVESAFQGSKVFAHGGPYRDMYMLSGRQIKSDKRLRESGALLGFDFDGDKWSLEPKTAFYDWLYIQALIQNPDLSVGLSEFQGFTDIEFNPKKSINCQARSAALFVTLKKREMLISATSSLETFISILKTGYAQSLDIPKIPKVLQTQHAGKNFSFAKPLAQDTSPAAERVLINLWREMPAWRKMELVGEMNAAVKTLARAGVEQRFPKAAPEEIERRLKDVLLGKEVAARVYGVSNYRERVNEQ